MNNKTIYRKLKEKIKELKGFQIVSTISLSFYIICLYGLILMIQTLVDSLTSSHRYTFEIVSLGYVFILLVILALSGFISQYFFNQLPIRAKNIFLGKLYKDILKKKPAFLDDNNRGEIYSLLNNDAISFAQLVGVNPVVLSYQLITLLLCVILMLLTQWILALVLMIFVLLCFSFTTLLSKKIANSSKNVFQKKEMMTKQMLEGLQNHKVISILSKESFFSLKFQKFLQLELQPLEKKAAYFQSLYMTVYILLTIVLPFLSVAVGIYFVSIHLMSIGQVLTMYALASQLQEPIRQIADIRTNRLTAMQLAERLSILLYKSDSRKIAIDSIESIKLDDVNFSYDEKPVINNLTMNINRNEHILVKGDSGCGKSTLLSLLMGFQKKQSGQITVNNLDIDDVNLKSYYKSILMVDQRSFIFHDTIKNNITLYDNYTDEKINEVLSVCQLTEIYSENRDNRIDESNISGGQAQRISIARMLIRRPDILLLDEPTSALDEKTSMALSEELNTYCKKYNITLLIVSHKKDIMSICNKTITLH